ncbi:hypothetical protein [Phaeobacter sp. 11ANDIMAR09]|uniref:hypothetical protein n=1 Tax=Phaeobacter sp. 11ANDIMAR09 TaxID=1225647 RepID=UPI0006D6A93E|nr:hypothetical protein [Phaeobacter sp. 11ANDIMAR09]KPD10630.1 hypothetical protein AN476_20015 [Phaeobacter sp. 11ANDIMAR09]
MSDQIGTIIRPYVSRPLLNGQELVNWANGLGLEDVIAPEKMHVTVLYSKTPVDISVIPLARDAISLRLHNARPFRISSALGLPIEHPKIDETHKRYLAIGATHDYANGVFRPHITLRYDASEKDLDVFSTTRGFTGSLELGAEQIEPLRSGWRP